MILADFFHSWDLLVESPYHNKSAQHRPHFNLSISNYRILLGRHFTCHSLGFEKQLCILLIAAVCQR